jgi:predicted hydrocarbon binding protein
MKKDLTNIQQLKAEIFRLKRENTKLKKSKLSFLKGSTVRVPKEMQPLFDTAQKTVGDYFESLRLTPSKGSIDINGERYILVRASALSLEFLNSISHFYRDRGKEEALNIGKNILFDLAHMLGIEDAKNFHKKMGLKDPISKLSAGPVHFAYSGWAFVDILKESKPSPDKKFYIKYNHPYSFEADSWVKARKKSETPVCIMNSGYSSGWCEASFGITLTAVEITCKAKGDKNCSFIMAPPDKIEQYLKQNNKRRKAADISIPAFLERKKIE